MKSNKSGFKGFYGWLVLGMVVLGLQASAPAHAAAAASSSGTGEVILSISDAYVPSGFDSNSDAFVVVNGLSPNTCYSWKEAQVSHVNALEHEIRSVATVRPGICMMMLVPFQHEIQLGHLVSGKHTLRFVGGDGTYVQKTLNVE